MKVLFFGSGAFGLPTLAALDSHHEVVGVVSQPDRPAGRGGRFRPTPIAEWTHEHRPGLSLLKPERVNEATVVEKVRSMEADAWVVIAFGQKLGRALLADQFAVNLHASLLPRWRGAAPINAAIVAGDAESGNSVITLADRMDAGLILGQTRTPIDPSKTAGEIHDQLAELGPALMLDVLERSQTGGLAPFEQDESLVTVAPKLSRAADGWVDFSAPARECRQRVHGLTPWPGVGVTIGAEAVKLIRVRDEEVAGPGACGTVIDAEAGLVACGVGALRLLEVQPSGGRVMDWGSYARGRQVSEGMMVRGGCRCS